MKSVLTPNSELRIPNLPRALSAVVLFPHPIRSILLMLAILIIYPLPVMANERYCAYLDLAGLSGKRARVSLADGNGETQQVVRGRILKIEPSALVLSLNDQTSGLYDTHGKIVDSGPLVYLNCIYIQSVVVESDSEKR